jgi:hypothetical protein
MAFLLEQVVPWGRSFDEYVSMFDLAETELGLRILGCGDGPAAFNAEMTQRGEHVVSIDPVYLFTTEQIKSRIAETYEVVMAQMRNNQEDYIWHTIPSVEHLGHVRMAAMESFLIDFETGKQEGRYVAGELPLLPFEDAQFDIALSSHFLFLYSDHLSCEFHLQALKEMLRVADEVRVFPLLTLEGKLSPHLAPVKAHFANSGFKIEIKRVAYEFQRGGNEMLVINRA